MPANLTTKLGQLVDVLTPDTTNTRIGVANASPTRTLDVTGTFGASGASTLGGALTYGGVTLSNAVTGTGNMVLSASPTLTGTLTGAAANFSGTITAASGAWSSAGIYSVASVTVGEASNAAYAPLSVYGAAAGDRLFIDNLAASGTNGSIAFGASATPNVGARILSQDDGQYGTNLLFQARHGSAGTTTTTNVTFLSTGQVGIGKTPTYALDVSGRGGFDATLYLAPTNATYPDALNIARKSGAQSITFSNVAAFNTSDSTGYQWNIGGSAKLNLDASGNLGIGMTPSNILDITQNQNADSQIQILNNSAGNVAYCSMTVNNGTSSGTFVQFGTGNTFGGINRANGTYLAARGAGGLTINTEAAQPIYFGINNAEVARFGTDGSFLVGTTTNGGWTGNAKGVFQSSARALSVYNSGTIQDALLLRVDNTAVTLVTINYNGSGVGSITTNGTTTAYNVTSDYRLKENVQPMTGGLATVAALKPVTYNWISNGSAGEGFIAHELQAVIPEAVHGEKDAVDDKGEIKPQGVDFGKIVPHLVAAIQELTTRLAALENK
jgi:hypothetical protein